MERLSGYEFVKKIKDEPNTRWHLTLDNMIGEVQLKVMNGGEETIFLGPDPAYMNMAQYHRFMGAVTEAFTENMEPRTFLERLAANAKTVG